MNDKDILVDLIHKEIGNSLDRSTINKSINEYALEIARKLFNLRSSTYELDSLSNEQLKIVHNFCVHFFKRLYVSS